MTTMPIIDQLGRVNAAAPIPEHVKDTLRIIAGLGGTYSNIYDADHALRELQGFLWRQNRLPIERRASIYMQLDACVLAMHLYYALRSNDWRGRLIELINDER